MSDVFRMIRLESCVYFQREFRGPWAMRIGPTPMAQFHLVLGGPCVVETGAACQRLAPGDVVLFPRGQAHVLADRTGRRPVAGAEAMASFASRRPMFAEGDAATRVICGHYAYRTRPQHPLIAGLPDTMHIPMADAGIEMEATANLLIAETAGAEQGSGPIVERLAEVLLVRALRAWLRLHPAEPGLLHGLMDRRLSRALRCIHREFDAPLTLEDLAGEAGMSRSSFAEQFKSATGLGAIQYLSQWRMLSAGDMLRDAGLSIAEVASRIGYSSDIAFARAFRRAYGVTPAVWRRHEAPDGPAPEARRT